MKKQDLLVIAVLFVLLMAWPFLYKHLIKPIVEPVSVPPAYTQKETGVASGSPVTSTPSVTMREAAPQIIPAKLTPPAMPEENKSLPGMPEQFVTVSNAGLSIVISSWGGGIKSATFDNYRKSAGKNSGPLTIDFTNIPTMTYRGLNGFSADDSFTMLSNTPAMVVMEGVNSNGLKLTRTMEINDKYQVIVSDLFANTNAQAQTIPKYAVQIGPMQMLASDYRMSGIHYLGIDARLASGGEGVAFWAGKLVELFKTVMKENSLPYLPKSIIKNQDRPIDWLAVKNKFFVQILVPDGGAAGYSLMAERVTAKGEDKDASLAPRSAEIKAVSATVLMSDKTLNSGETFSQVYKLYLGPKKQSILRTLGLRQEDVMEFGGFLPSVMVPISTLLLIVLNATYSVIPNYGVAIIILTILLRIVFWPLTHKGTESMKKMQELQPLMAELKAKYKDNPRKMQEETMALYRKHKVNPMSGCLPMLIQLPVFIAFFIVLRSAVELRFAPFLWIHDLSAPERLFADILPFPLNILPIFMAASQAWQQTLMPATDPNQQKMMLFFMPAVMLVMFYPMPSALVLYWSANQCIVIIQQLVQKKKTVVPVKK
jgi:YidC/Oxa1 family membrane protein insertase